MTHADDMLLYVSQAQYDVWKKAGWDMEGFYVPPHIWDTST